MGGVPEKGQWRRADDAVDDDAVVAELCHVAGLTAGRSLPLRPGTLSVGIAPSPEGGLTEATPSALTFDLVIGADGAVQLVAGTEPIAVEGVLVEGTAHLEDGDVIQLRSDHFRLRTAQRQPIHTPVEPLNPRTISEPPNRSWPSPFWWWLCAVLVVLGILLGVQRTAYFGLSLIGLGGAIAIFALRRRRHDHIRSEQARLRSNARSLFFNQILDSRKFAAASARSGALDPFEVARRASASARPIGDRLPVTLASGDRAWTPSVVLHRDPGWDHEAIVDELSFLPAIPITMDLAASPIAVTGDRRAALAVARHLITGALLTAPNDRGVAVDSLIPADWRWLSARSQPMLRVLDGKAGPWVPRTIVIASSPEGLARLGDPRVFGAILDVALDGSTTIIGPDGTFGTDLVAHGISEAQAQRVHDALRFPGPTIDLREVQPVVDLSDTALPTAGQPTHDLPTTHLADIKGPWVVDGPSSWLDPSITMAPMRAVEMPPDLTTPLGVDRVVVSGPDVRRNKDVLASAALLQARQHPDRSIYILDRGDRALIRLSQLANCRCYAAIDQIGAVGSMVDELSGLVESTPGSVLLLAPDLWDAIAFYRNADHPHLADRLEALVGRVRLLPMAASSQTDPDVSEASFLVWIDSTPTPMTASVRTSSGATERHDIDPTQLPGIDLTGSVARLVASMNETP